MIWQSQDTPDLAELNIDSCHDVGSSELDSVSEHRGVAVNPSISVKAQPEKWE